MTFPAPEVLLLLVAIGLYLTDAAHRLYSNEVFFVRGRGSTWAVRFALSYPEFGRRFLVLPSPLEPHRALIKAGWPGSVNTDGLSPETFADPIATCIKKLRPLQWASALLLPQIFLVLPLLYIYVGSSVTLFAWVGAIYLQIIAMTIFLIARRKEVGIPGMAVAVMVFESIICMPYAINLYRKAVLACSPPGPDILVLSQALLDGDELGQFRRQLASSIDDQLRWRDSNDASNARLLAFRARLDEELVA